jgi:hypothetical protein
MITVEGLDNTGKTTLVERLRTEFPDLHYRPSIGNKHDMQMIRNQAEAEAYQFRHNVLSDRSRIISEFIYTPTIGARATAYPVWDWLRYLGQWVQRPQLLIYCTRNLTNVQLTFDEDDREQLAHVYENLEELHEGYEFTMRFIDWLFRQSPRGHRLVFYDFDMAAEDFDPVAPVKDAVKQYLLENS